MRKLIYNSIGESLEAAHQNRPHWNRHGEALSSERGCDWAGGLSFDKFRAGQRDQPATTFARELASIMDISSEILGELPTKNAKTRKRVPARRGGRPSSTALLAGNYSRAFTSWEIKWTHRPPTHVAIMMPCVFSWTVPLNQIAYSMGAPIALGMFLESEFGISVDLWAVAKMNRVWFTGERDGLFVTRLKPPTGPIILEDIACVAHPGWLRSYLFRQCENQDRPNAGYGFPADLSDVSKLCLEIAESQAIHGPVLIGVSGQNGLLRNKETALKWVDAQFRVLQLID